MLKVWNASLVLATGILAVLGTFLVRSGILDSIHAFGASTLGVPFVTLIAAMIAGSIWLVVSRRDALRSEHRLDSLLSREAIFLGNNLVLVGLAFVVFWGTFFPLISEAVTGTKAAVGPPWFDRYTVPLALVLVLLSGIGPVIAWRRATAASVRRTFLVPVAAALAVVVVLVAAGVTGSLDRPGSCSPWRLRPRGRRSGPVARRRRAPRDGGRGAGARARRARAPQPPALRRLHGPRRDGGAVRRRGRVVGLPARARRPALAGPDDPDRRLRRPLRARDVVRHPAVGRRRARQLRGRDRRAPRRQARRRCCVPSAATTPRARSWRSVRSGGFFEGESASEVGHARRRLPRRVDGGPARHRRAAADHRRGRQVLRARRGQAERRRPVGGAGHRDHAPRRALPRPAAAGDVPADRLADGRLDLDRRR